jgi:hypothetical protein
VTIRPHPNIRPRPAPPTTPRTPSELAASVDVDQRTIELILGGQPRDAAPWIRRDVEQWQLARRR